MSSTSESTSRPTYQRILVPIDGSDASRAALQYASHIPCKELILLHVVVDREVIIPDWVLGRGGSKDETSMKDSLEDLAAELTTDERKVSVSIRVGDVAEEIIAAGDEVDLIVMMTHGRGAAGRMIFGSMADRVVRHGVTPTLLVRVGELTRHPKKPTRVVVAADGSERAEKGVPAAADLAEAMGLPLHIVRSVGLQEVKAALRTLRHNGQPLGPRDISPTLYDDTLKTEISDATTYIEEKAAELRDRGLEVTTEVLEGSVPFTLLWAVDGDDILVITSRGRGGYKRWALGSVAEKLVRESPCPVLLQRGPEDLHE